MIILDTHVIVWLAREPDRLSPRVHQAIVAARKGDGVCISGKSLWELAMIFRHDPSVVRPSLLAFLQAVEQQFNVLPITAEIALKAIQFTKAFPRAPGDRLIAATALVYGAELVTKDRLIHASGEVSCIW